MNSWVRFVVVLNMKSVHLALAALALLLLAVAQPLRASDPTPLRYSGNYEWNEGGRGRLEVSFFPDGQGGWDVTFRFDHARRFQTWSGSAIGVLGSGNLEGLAQRGRYKFYGTFEDGVFRGRHFEVRRNGLRESGTLTFKTNPERSLSQ